MSDTREPVAIPQRGQLPQLDGLRGVAIVLVLIGHITQFSLHRFETVGNFLAQLGVLLFFVLSGFLITSIITAEKTNRGTVDLKNFYWRRILRLAPAFLVFMSAVYWLMSKGWIPQIPRYEIAACLLYVRNIVGRSEAVAHLWSLSLEEQFYTLWPPIVKFVESTKLIWIAILLTVGMSVWRGVAIALHLFDYNLGIYYIRPYFRFDSILIGCSLALLLNRVKAGGHGFGTALTSTPLWMVWVLVLAWTLVGDSLAHPIYISVQMLCVTWLVFRIVTGSRFYWLTSPPFRFMGKISYSLYLWQQILIVSVYPMWRLVHAFPMNLICCFLLATVSYFGIERPFLRIKDRGKGSRNRASTLESGVVPALNSSAVGK